MEPNVTDTLVKSACEVYNPYRRTACALGKYHHVMQVRMLFSLHKAVQLAPSFLQDAPCAPYTVYIIHVGQRRIAADPAAATCRAPL